MIKYSLLVLALAFFGAASASFTLQNFCKGQPVELKSVQDVEFLIKSFTYGPTPGCSGSTRQSILDLEPIINADNVCSEEVAKKIGHYYANYVSKKNMIHRWRLQKATKDFFLALSFEISRVCEKALMDNLSRITEQKIQPKDAIELLNFNDNLNDVASKISGREMRIQDLFLVTSMDGIISRKWNEPNIYTKETVAVKRDFKLKFDRVKVLCRNKFKPIYEKLITPLVILTNVGFEYTSGQVNTQRPDFKDSYDYKAWYTGVLMCEAILAQNVIEAPESSSEMDEDSMTILEEEDLERLEKETGLDLDEQPITEDVRQEYNLKVRLDRSTDFTSDELRREAKTVSKKRKEAKNLRKLVYKRLTSCFVEATKSDNIKVGLSEDGLESPARRKHWVKRYLLYILPLVMLGGVFISPFITFFAGLIWFALLFARSQSPRDEWH